MLDVKINSPLYVPYYRVSIIYLYTTQLEPGVPLPSPELLKGKILLKDKIKLKKLKE